MKNAIAVLKLSVAFFAIVSLFNPSISSAQNAGSLDLSFSSDGKATHGLGGIGNAVVIQPDGKIVVAGGGTFGATRFNADGSVDSAFGTNGIATTAFGTNAQYAKSVALQA